MPAVIDEKALHHEEFCLPRPGESKPRLEGYVAYRDGEGGRSVPTAFVTRCLECGVAAYKRMET